LSGEERLRIEIIVDADACPVKQEIYKVAERHGVKTLLVANSMMAFPRGGAVELVTVGKGFDEADDWIAERACAAHAVITADIPLASRCVAKGALVISPTGNIFTKSTIGNVLATRNLMQDLREAGTITSGPKPFSAKDRSAFLSALDIAVNRLKRAGFSA
jgi:uncharacterized protein YaiI (UPF0178 family)